MLIKKKILRDSLIIEVLSLLCNDYEFEFFESH
jgi:hypothetical protein